MVLACTKSKYGLGNTPKPWRVTLFQNSDQHLNKVSSTFVFFVSKSSVPRSVVHCAKECRELGESEGGPRGAKGSPKGAQGSPRGAKGNSRVPRPNTEPTGKFSWKFSWPGQGARPNTEPTRKFSWNFSWPGQGARANTKPTTKFSWNCSWPG